METTCTQEVIGEGITLCSVPTERFKTSEISFNMAMPLTKETAAANALVPYLLHRSCQKYPSYAKLSAQLAYLYGATPNASVVKNGDCQILRVSIDAIDDRFSLTEENISAQCTELLCNMLFEPHMEGWSFPEEAVEQEKRLMVERIESEMNEKRVYALQRCEEEMCKGEAYGLSRFGTMEDVQSLTKEQVFKAWVNIMTKAKIQINVIGSGNTDQLKTLVQKYFGDINRENITVPATQYVKEAKTVKKITERMPIAQGKLVLGFRTGIDTEHPLTPAMRAMADIFGGGPYSRLFMNVREKMSLCYYCSARYIKHKGILMVQCGVEEENMEKAVKEIQNQLDAMKTNTFLDSEFEASRLAMADSLKVINDTPEELDAWYLSQINNEKIITPEQLGEQNEKVTREAITEAAKLVTLDTIYALVPELREEKE